MGKFDKKAHKAEPEVKKKKKKVLDDPFDLKREKNKNLGNLYFGLA